MFRTSLATAYLKRTFRPLYGWTQATPKSGYLDPVWARTVALYPGFALTKTVGNNYAPLGTANSSGNKAAQTCAGFLGQWVGGAGIDELLESGVNALSVWTLGPDAEFEVLAPAFDAVTGGSWATADVVGNDGVDKLIYDYVDTVPGQLCLSNGSGGTVSTNPVARLIQVESTSTIIIAGLRAGDTTTS
jgi:hypothetical protein